VGDRAPFHSLEVSYKNGEWKVKNAESLTDEFPPQIASAVVTIKPTQKGAFTRSVSQCDFAVHFSRGV
jgi:hypothetical protein